MNRQKETLIEGTEFMNEQHQAILKELLRTETIPDEVAAYYNRVKRLCDRKDIGITNTMLVLIAARAKDIEGDKKPKAANAPAKNNKPETADKDKSDSDSASVKTDTAPSDSSRKK